MHSYATDSSERKLVPFLVAAIGVLLAWLLHWTLQTLRVTVPWWIDAPSIMGFYVVLYSIFDKYLWRLQPVRKIGLVKVRDLNGTWKGYASSSFDEYSIKHDATVTIRQSWTGITITFETEYSRSHSLIAAILTESSTGTIVSYEYLNEPKPEAQETMHTHRGTVRLVLSGESLEGEYYTGRDRQQYGSLSFRRLKEVEG